MMHELYMRRCVELALNGRGYVSPNPLVGAVVVHQGQIIGEGWHQQFGGPHAEVNALASVSDKSRLPQSTLYVNLEPCSHHGKTPPCTDLIIHSGIKHVVIGMTDPNPKVNGKGIERLINAGIVVISGVLETECRFLNRRFIVNQLHKKPYVILKWAQTKDGFVAPDRNHMSAKDFETKRHITGFIVQKLVHQWRTFEDAIMVGTQTIRTDNPALNNRAWYGPQPLRITIDRKLTLEHTYKIADGKSDTLIFTEEKNVPDSTIRYCYLDPEIAMPDQVLGTLIKEGLGSLIIEGGPNILRQFIESNNWDEIQAFTTPIILGEGIEAPELDLQPDQQTTIDGSWLSIYFNDRSN